MHQKAQKKDPHKPSGSRWKSYCTHTLRRQNKSPYPKIQSICAICANCGIYIFILKKYLHYLLKQLLLKKIWNFPQRFKIKCHTLYCQERLQTLFWKARLWNLHTNFPIKSLSYGKDSWHADRQMTKQFYCFFLRKRVRKTGKSQLGKANSQYTTQTDLKYCCNNLNFSRSAKTRW